MANDNAEAKGLLALNAISTPLSRITLMHQLCARCKRLLEEVDAKCRVEKEPAQRRFSKDFRS
jgi:hypothetical protein